MAFRVWVPVSPSPSPGATSELWQAQQPSRRFVGPESMDRPCHIVINMWSVCHIECTCSCHRDVDYVFDFASTDTKHYFAEHDSHKEKQTTCAENILLCSAHIFKWFLRGLVVPRMGLNVVQTISHWTWIEPPLMQAEFVLENPTQSEIGDFCWKSPFCVLLAF